MIGTTTSATTTHRCERPEIEADSGRIKRRRTAEPNTQAGDVRPGLSALTQGIWNNISGFLSANDCSRLATWAEIQSRPRALCANVHKLIVTVLTATVSDCTIADYKNLCERRMGVLLDLQTRGFPDSAEDAHQIWESHSPLLEQSGSDEDRTKVFSKMFQTAAWGFSTVSARRKMHSDVENELRSGEHTWGLPVKRLAYDVLGYLRDMDPYTRGYAFNHCFIYVSPDEGPSLQDLGLDGLFELLAAQRQFARTPNFRRDNLAATRLFSIAKNLNNSLHLRCLAIMESARQCLQYRTNMFTDASACGALEKMRKNTLVRPRLRQQAATLACGFKVQGRGLTPTTSAEYAAIAAYTRTQMGLRVPHTETGLSPDAAVLFDIAIRLKLKKFDVIETSLAMATIDLFLETMTTSARELRFYMYAQAALAYSNNRSSNEDIVSLARVLKFETDPVLQFDIKCLLVRLYAKGKRNTEHLATETVKRYVTEMLEQCERGSDLYKEAQTIQRQLSLRSRRTEPVFVPKPSILELDLMSPDLSFPVVKFADCLIPIHRS